VSDKHNNSTFDNTQFQRDGDVSFKISLLYNCDTSTMNIFSTTCGNTKVSYTIMDPASVSLTCTPSVIVEFPILAVQAGQIATLNDINEALQSGFDLKWTGNYGECQKCVDSDGVCGSNNGGNEFRCFCKDGSHTTSCTSQKVLTSDNSMYILLSQPPIYVCF